MGYNLGMNTANYGAYNTRPGSRFQTLNQQLTPQAVNNVASIGQPQSVQTGMMPPQITPGLAPNPDQFQLLPQPGMIPPQITPTPQVITDPGMTMPQPGTITPQITPGLAPVPGQFNLLPQPQQSRGMASLFGQQKPNMFNNGTPTWATQRYGYPQTMPQPGVATPLGGPIAPQPIRNI